VNTKTALSEFEPVAAACKALAHPARLAIMQVLAQRGVCVCGEIVDEIPLSQATVSQHLKVLKGAGLIRGEIEGPRSCYCLDAETIKQLRERLGAMFSSFEACC
jgi:ArsR family transcriptional regulator